MFKTKTALLALALASLSTTVLADNRWYLVDASCRASNGTFHTFVATTEGSGKEGAQDEARFGFSKTIEDQFAGKVCDKPEVATQSAHANYVGDSRKEAEVYLQKFVKKEKANKSPVYVMDYNASTRVAKMR